MVYYYVTMAKIDNNHMTMFSCYLKEHPVDWLLKRAEEGKSSLILVNHISISKDQYERGVKFQKPWQE